MTQSGATTVASFANLETRGFTVIPGFLSDEEVELFRRDFEEQPLDSNLSYRVVRTSPQANTRLRARIEPVLEQVTANTNLQVDLFDGGIYFDTGPRHGVRFNWHQDAESFFRFQNHYDYLNFYIPLVKPRTDKSNLCILPFDVLEREDPRAFRHLVRSGASGLMRIGRIPVLVCGDAGTAHLLHADIERMAETPMLAVGDLLLMRGDAVHRTQDAETERVALSCRITKSSAVVNRRQLVAGGQMKATIMANNLQLYERMFAVFDRTGRSDLRVDEMREALEVLPPRTLRTRKGFLVYLLLQKVRSGVLSRFLLNVATTTALTWCARGLVMYERGRAKARQWRRASSAA